MKTATWVIRLFQLWFAIILVGIISYMIGQYNHYGFSPPRQLVVPEVFVCYPITPLDQHAHRRLQKLIAQSVLAIVTTVFSIACIFFLSYTFQLVAAFLE